MGWHLNTFRCSALFDCSTYKSIYLDFQSDIQWRLPTLLEPPAESANFISGDEGDNNNYRGNTIGPDLAKLYVSILEKSISLWAESNGVRAECQVGFPVGQRTTDHILTLLTLLDRHKAAKLPLYCYFVDCQKAFGTVPRTTPWERLHECGIYGKMLAALQAMCTSVRASVITQRVWQICRMW